MSGLATLTCFLSDLSFRAELGTVRSFTSRRPSTTPQLSTRPIFAPCPSASRDSDFGRSPGSILVGSTRLCPSASPQQPFGHQRRPLLLRQPSSPPGLSHQSQSQALHRLFLPSLRLPLSFSHPKQHSHSPLAFPRNPSRPPVSPSSPTTPRSGLYHLPPRSPAANTSETSYFSPSHVGEARRPRCERTLPELGRAGDGRRDGRWTMCPLY